MDDNRSDQTSSVPRIGLSVSLSLLALGSMIATVGFARLFTAQLQNAGSTHQACLWVTWGSVLVGFAALATLYLLWRLPNCDDCDRYGRHMIGLSYVLLVLGACNGVGMSTLALEGGLSISASTLLRASDPVRLTDALARLAQAKAEVGDTTLNHETKLKELDRVAKHSKDECARAKVKSAPTGSASASAPPSDEQQVAARLAQADCEKARSEHSKVDEERFALEVALAKAELAYKRAAEEHELCKKDCQAALFFLLSTSTLMALFGATFFVVNRVSRKRALVEPDEEAEGTSTPEPSHPTASTPSATQAKAERDPRERFDSHAFWSGALFRAGEAVLFTFSFFWLFWTSNWSVIWLPVLGLFVGMFVKTGETVVFQLGERLLLATEAVLPSIKPAKDAGAQATPKPEQKR